MSKKTIVIGTLSSLLVIGGVATTAGLLLSNTKIGTGEDITNRNTIITKTNIEDLLNTLQNEINKNELTRTQFASQNFADIVKNNLKAADKNIGHLIIEDGIRLTNGGTQIQISLNPRIEFQLDGIISADNLASYDSSNKILTLNISNLKYFNVYDVTVLNDLYDELNDYIIDPTRLFTSSEFLNYVETNNESIKQLVAKYLTFSASKTREINVSEIKNVIFNETANQLEITLNSDYRKYNLEPSNNITLTGNNIINVINFTFYKSNTISNTKLTSLENEIQSYINESNNMYTIEEFNSQIATSSFKTKIANYLSIPASSINTISYIDNKLIITPASMHKFVNDLNVIIGDVEVTNLRFYLSESLINLDELYNAFNNYIINTTRKYTTDEFARYISVDSVNAKQLVADNLYISETQKIDVSQITNIEFDTTDNANILKITLDNNYRKYNLNPTNNVTLNQNIISISNFTFYAAYQTTDAKLNNLKNNIQDYINLLSNQFSLEEFTNQLNSVDFKDQISTYLSIPANTIDTISYNNNTLIITPIPMVKFTSDTVSGSTNIINQISVNDLKFYSSTDLIGLENLYNVLNNYIIDSSRKFTVKQFADQVTDNNSTIKSLVINNLYVDENNKIDSILVSSVTFNETNKQLEVTLNSDYKKYNLTSTDNVSLNGNIMTISGFTFYDGIEIGETELNSFEQNLQNYINEVSNQYTQEQFINQLNLDGFKNLVSTSLSIPVSSINSISFDNGTLTISPNSMKKFMTPSTSNLIVQGSIQVNGLKFYTEQSLVNLNLLYNSLRDYILNTTRKYTSDEFANITNNVDNAGIKQIVASKLYVAENQLINESDITSVSFNTISNQLEITLNNSYKKYTLSGSDNVVWENGKLVVKNLSFYTAISITPEKLNGLKSFAQDYINQASNQYTLSEFNDQVDGDDFRDAIANYLSINNLSINAISFANNTLTISPLTLQKFTSTEKNSVLVNGSLQVSNFDFYTSYTFTKLNDLSNALNSWITNYTRTYTSEEFAKNFSTNSTAIKDLVLKNLYISSTQLIDASKVSSVTFNTTTNNLEVEFTNDFSKYSLPSDTTNFEMSNNKLIIKNLTFYTGVNLSDDVLTNLQKNIQSFINLSTNQFSSTEFTNQITSDTFKDELARVLSIKTSQIGTITFTNDILKIQPVNMQKFVSSQASSLLIDNNIQVSGFNFFSSVTLTSPQNLYNFVNNYIVDASRKYTKEEFSDFIKTNNSQFKLNIAKSLTKQNGGTVSVGEISSISLNSDNNLVITLDGSQDAFFKYSVSSNNNVVVENGSLVVKNLTYYLDLTISDENLQNLWNNLNNYIDENDIRVGEGGDIGNYLNYGIFNLFKNVVTNQNGKLGQFLQNIRNLNSSIKDLRSISVILKSGLYKMDSKNLNKDDYLGTFDIVISDNSLISMNNLKLSSPDSYFNINVNDYLSSLSTIGLNQQFIIFNKKYTSASSVLFNKNSIIKEVDMSLSQITRLESGQTSNNYSGFFYNSSNLSKVFLPKSLNYLGHNVLGCTAIRELFIPNSVTFIGVLNIYNLNNLTKVNLPSNLKTISRYNFYDCNALSSSIIIPNGVTSLPDMFFNNCSNINYLYIPNSVNSIVTNNTTYVNIGKNIIFHVDDQNYKDWLINKGSIFTSSNVVIGL